MFVSASIPGFSLGIDLCDGDASCVIQIQPSKSTKLTCTATDASPSMELKWFNGSSEITEGIENKSPVMTGTSRIISATLYVAPECTGSLICQAVDHNAKDVSGRFALVQLQLPGSAIKEASTGWMVTAIISLVTCIVLIAVLAFIIVKSRKTKRKDKSKPEEGEKLMEVNDKDKEINVKQGKMEELTTKVNDRDNEIKVKQGKIDELTAETQIKDNELQVKVRELTKLQEEVIKKDNEIKNNVEEIYQLKAAIQSKDNETGNKDEELSRLKAVIKSKDEDLSRFKTHEQESLDKLKKVKSDEEQIKINFRKLENSERSFREKKMDDLENIYVTVIPKGGSLVGIKRDGNSFTLKHSSTMYRFPHIFSIGAAAREIYEKVNCYVENAIDGGDSLVIAFGTSRSNPQFTTMYGDTEWKNAILPLTYKKIFERANQIKTRKYSVNLRSRFAHVLEDENNKGTSKVPESTFVDGCKDPMTMPSTESKDENSIERLFIEHRESITKGGSKHNCYVQYFIDTEEDHKTMTTGTITLVTLFEARVAKATFEKEGLKSPLEQFLADIAYKANSRCLLLAHLNEDKDDVKEVLKVAKTVC
ncbi:uncharacterized protein [Apostichopus japonicus]|uniref:uncharacterized protein n=1 Tax=Stichopus japonicus TaxID=307972 RepID=UPI003AB2600F